VAAAVAVAVAVAVPSQAIREPQACGHLLALPTQCTCTANTTVRALPTLLYTGISAIRGA
jgi:hypothetical protein